MGTFVASLHQASNSNQAGAIEGKSIDTTYMHTHRCNQDRLKQHELVMSHATDWRQIVYKEHLNTKLPASHTDRQP